MSRTDLKITGRENMNHLLGIVTGNGGRKKSRSVARLWRALCATLRNFNNEGLCVPRYGILINNKDILLLHSIFLKV